MTTLALREHKLHFAPGDPLVMGVVNASQDSFSDARRLRTVDDQLAHALALVEAGADLIDVGGESGVTYNGLSQPEAELARVLPLVERLVARGVPVSVDTFKPAVAAAVLDAGASMINDVSGLRAPELARLCAGCGAALVIMHTRAEPKKVLFPGYEDVVGDVVSFLVDRAGQARALGLPADRILLDPGPDFAKSPEETVEVLRAWPRLAGLGYPLLAAVSRKYFIGAITGREPHDRLAGTVAAVLWAAGAGAAMIRVHDVADAVDALAVRRVLAGEVAVPAFDAADESLKWIREG